MNCFWTLPGNGQWNDVWWFIERHVPTICSIEPARVVHQRCCVLRGRGWDSDMDDFCPPVGQVAQGEPGNKFNRPWSGFGETKHFGTTSLRNTAKRSPTYWITRAWSGTSSAACSNWAFRFRQLMSDWKQFYLTAEQRVSSDYISLPTRTASRHRTPQNCPPSRQWR